MKKVFFLLCLIGAIQGMAQPVDSRGIYDYKDIQHVDMGWMAPLKIIKPTTPFSKNGWSYTAKQTEISQQIGMWLEQTYRTVGVLGDKKLVLLFDEPSKYRGTKEYGYNEVEKDAVLALPNSYGAKGEFHFCVSKVKDRKFWPTPGNWCFVNLHIMVNNIGLIAEQVVALNSPKDYYFLMPKYTIGEKGRNDRAMFTTMANYRNFTKSPNLEKYQHYVFPKAKTMGYIIIMSKDGKPLPVEQVTVGEFLDQLEAQLPLMLQMAQNRKLIYENYFENAKKGMVVLKEKLKGQLNQYFYTYDNFLQIDVTDIANVGSSGNLPNWIKTQAQTQEGHTNIPLWRLKKGVKESLATAGPEWVIFKLEAPFNFDYEGSVRLVDDFVSRFNYDYVYNYFWGKDKTITPYKPTGFVDEQVKFNSQAATEKSATAKQKSTDKNILFFEDFSSVAEGATPPGWNTERSALSGKGTQVAAINNQPGKWLKMVRDASPKINNISGTADFELSVNVLVHKGDVPWGATPLEVELHMQTAQGATISRMGVTPGNMNQATAEGWLTLSGKSAASACKPSSYYNLPQFKGSDQQSKITLLYRKKGQNIQVLCNNKTIFECTDFFLPNTTLQKLNFANTEKSIYYIGNIELKKL